MKTIKSVYKIGNGPSSSHTVGPYHAAQTFGSRYPDADSYEVTLYGSLAFTGELLKKRILPWMIFYQLQETDARFAHFLFLTSAVFFFLLTVVVIHSVFHEGIEADENFLTVHGTVPFFVLAATTPATEQGELQEIQVRVKAEYLLTDGNELFSCKSLLYV